ncbi:MAG: hypothetical protein RIS76_3888 [Verrucomicrobiota bacterium]|jgi:hypothetical protein
MIMVVAQSSRYFRPPREGNLSFLTMSAPSPVPAVSRFQFPSVSLCLWG